MPPIGRGCSHAKLLRDGSDAVLIADYIAIGALIACILVLCAVVRAERTRNARRWRQCNGRGLDKAASGRKRSLLTL